ncbi:MAG: hypothetical protein JWN67_3730 [Actinomycetia bacterium]|nr:hypothetical protein [Actinomycetes bacterium]
MADEIAPDGPDATEVDLAPPVPKAKNRRVALAIGALAVVAGGVFAAISLAGSTNDPEDPVRAMFAAAEQGDVLGVLAQLDPGERDALQGPVTDLVDQLNRLDVLHDADLGHVSGVDLQVDDLVLKSTVVRDDIARVTAKGTTKGSVDVSKLPLGGFVRDLMGESDEQQTDAEGMAGEIDTGGDFVTTVKRGDRWYVSIGYSIAELARRDAGVSFAEMGAGVAPKGADTPEAAVRQLVQAGAEIDVRRILELLPPGELGAVQDYAGLFLRDAQRSAADAGLQAVVSSLELDSETDGDHGLVFLRGGSFSATAGDLSVKYGGGCLDVVGQAMFAPTDGAGTTHICNGTDPAEALKGLGLDGVEPPKLSFEGKQPKFGIAVTKVDGKWYVSPTRTLLGGLVAELEVFQPKDLKELVSYVQEVFTTTMERTFSSFEGSTDLNGAWCNYAPAGQAPSGVEVVPDSELCPVEAPASVPTTTTSSAS